MTFKAINRQVHSSAPEKEFGQGAIAERDAAPSSIKYWVVDSTDPDTTEHDKTYVLKEGGWVEQGTGTATTVNPAGTF